MNLSEVIVPLGGTEADRPVLRRAAALAAKGCSVTALLAQPDPNRTLAWAADGAFTMLPESAVRATREALDLVHEACVGRCQEHPGVAVERLVGIPAAVLAERAVLAGLGLFDAVAVRGGGDLRTAFETLLLDARLPVLLCSSDTAPGGPVAIGWDGGAAGARAVRAALPMLQAAPEVWVIQVPEPVAASGRGFADPDLVAERLRSYGMQVRVELAPAFPGLGPAQALVEAAEGLGASMLVAGAYGHSRLREVILGGVTRHLLSMSTRMDLFLAH
jgi:nucleotide-binding universal stress UspA family protein